MNRSQKEEPTERMFGEDTLGWEESFQGEVRRPSREENTPTKAMKLRESSESLHVRSVDKKRRMNESRKGEPHSLKRKAL